MYYILYTYILIRLGTYLHCIIVLGTYANFKMFYHNYAYCSVRLSYSLYKEKYLHYDMKNNIIYELYVGII